MINIGVLRAVLQVKDDLTPGIKRAATSLKTEGAAAAKAVASFAAPAIAVIGGLSAAAAVGINHVINLGDQITTLSAKTGLSTDFLQQLNHAANQLDVPFQSAANAISKLQVNLGKATTTRETTDALDSLGLSIERLRSLAPEQQFEQVAGAIAKMKDQAGLAATAQALFGRGGVELIPLLKGNYAELMAEAEKLGIVLDQDLLEAGDELGEQWKLLKTIGISLLAEVIAPMVKGLSDLASWAVEASKGFREMNAAAATQAEMHQRINELIKSREAATEAEARAIVMAETEAKRIQELNAAVADFVAQRDAATGSVREEAEQLAASAAESVRAQLAIKEHNESLRELASFTGLSVKELREQNQAFRDVARSMLEASRGTRDYTDRSAEAASATLDFDARLSGLPAKLSAEELAALQAAIALAKHESILRQAAKSAEELGIRTGESASAIKAITEKELQEYGIRTGENSDFTKEFSDILSETRGVMNILGVDSESTAGKIIEGFSRVFDTFNSVLGIVDRLSGLFGKDGGFLSGLGSLFGGGGGGGASAGGGIGGILGGGLSLGTLGIGGLIGAGVFGVSKLIGSLFGGRGPEDVQEEIQREMGVAISEGLAGAIEETGKSNQLFLPQIFAEGGLGVDRLAEEVGDIFSVLEQGGISRGDAFAAINASTEILLENLERLGPAGEEQIDRILGAADRFDIHSDALDRLGAAAGRGTAGPGPAAAPGESAPGPVTNVFNNTFQNTFDNRGSLFPTDPNKMAEALSPSVEKIFEQNLRALDDRYGRRGDN